jgi:hypothetical protein
MCVDTKNINFQVLQQEIFFKYSPLNFLLFNMAGQIFPLEKVISTLKEEKDYRYGLLG